VRSVSTAHLGSSVEAGELCIRNKKELSHHVVTVLVLPCKRSHHDADCERQHLTWRKAVTDQKSERMCRER